MLNKTYVFSNLRTTLMMLLGFARFPWFSEAASLRKCDIVFYQTCMGLFIEKSKREIYLEECWIRIVKFDSEICSVEKLSKS